MIQSPKRLRTLLIASLLGNVFLIGAVAGGVYQWSSHPRAQGAMVQHGLRQALAQLPEARRNQLRHMLRETRAGNQPLIMASREAHQDVVRRLKAPALDRNALDEDLDRARAADITLRTRVDATLADFAASLPADERQTLADAMTARRQGKRASPVND
ncbi:periplasmic heavy metal sensor [Pseudomonas sp. Pseu.R1]|uniref:periplasmic heavy metal sensor n=1 Tax=Pseudomonas sp. Pseu.R1 TaxID=3379818 RepID=UPI003B925009